MRSDASDFPAVVMKISVSKASFLRRVEKDMNIILLFDICRRNIISCILSKGINLRALMSDIT